MKTDHGFTYSVLFLVTGGLILAYAVGAMRNGFPFVFWGAGWVVGPLFLFLGGNGLAGCLSARRQRSPLSASSTVSPELRRCFEAWRLSPSLHKLEPPALESDLQTLEEALGRTLPTSFRGLYLLSNGPELLEGNLNMYPVSAEGGWKGLDGASDDLRDWGIPDELVVFGDNGSDSFFGIWIGDETRDPFESPVIQIYKVVEPENKCVIGTSFLPFLTGWTAYYLMVCEADTSALDALGLPLSLRFQGLELDDEAFTEITKWADPRLPDPHPGQEHRLVDTEALSALFRP